MRRTLPRFLLLTLLAPPLAAQVPVDPTTPDTTLVDRVVAVVGDSAILATQVQEEVLLAQTQGRTVDPAEVLENLVNLQLILQAAARDTTLVADDADVERRVEAQIERVRERFTNPVELEQALAQAGLTLATYREQLRANFKTDLVRQMFLQRSLQSAPTVAVTEEEMRAVFEQRRGELQQRPETYSVHQVLIRAGASDSAWARAERLADSLYTEVARGGDFEALATQHSQDPGSAPQGGELGWVQRGQTVPEFEQAVFSIRDGGVSPPVRTEYGFHVIRVERSRPGEKRVRHILVRPDVREEDLARTRELAEDVARRLREGEDAAGLARVHGDPALPAQFTFAPSQPEGVPAEFVQSLAGSTAGQVVGPLQWAYQGRTYFVVLKVGEVRQAGEFTFEDLRETIRESLLQQKRVERIYRNLRERTYVEIRN